MDALARKQAKKLFRKEIEFTEQINQKTFFVFIYGGKKYCSVGTTKKSTSPKKQAKEHYKQTTSQLSHYFSRDS